MVVAFPAIPVERLSESAHIAVDVELPQSREFRPRLLECTATVSGMRLVAGGLRISANVTRMSIKDRNPNHNVSGNAGADEYGIQLSPSIERPRQIHSVLHSSHPTQKLRGEHLFADGGDMVEYGLVIALVVLACIAVPTALQGSIGGSL